MTDRRTPVKAAALLAPLILSVLALHAWGDALAGGLGRAVCNWQYPERNHAIFQIRVPRRSDDVDAFAARTLYDFVTETVKVHGSDLGLRTPTEPIKVVLMLAPDTDVLRFRWMAAARLLNKNEGLYDPAGRTIYVRMEHNLQQEAVIAALRQCAARALLHDVGSDRWSPWLAEGLVGCLEGAKPAALRTPAGAEMPSLSLLLTARTADFQGINASAYARGAKLLAAFLLEAKSAEFAYYYDAIREGLQVPDSLFSNPTALESEWKKWLHDQK
jgi:hypothetical protein